jgi:hypothetical protein
MVVPSLVPMICRSSRSAKASAAAEVSRRRTLSLGLAEAASGSRTTTLAQVAETRVLAGVQAAPFDHSTTSPSPFASRAVRQAKRSSSAFEARGSTARSRAVPFVSLAPNSPASLLVFSTEASFFSQPPRTRSPLSKSSAKRTVVLAAPSWVEVSGAPSEASARRS